MAHDLALRVHRMTLGLPALERFEEATQVRRSSKSVSANIVEGHALRNYKALYLSFLHRALASSDEAYEHLLYLKETESLKDKALGAQLLAGYETRSRKLFRFIEGVQRQHQAVRPELEEAPEFEDPDLIAKVELARRHPPSAIRNRARSEGRSTK